MTQEEGNKLIALFMGAEISPYPDGHFPGETGYRFKEKMPATAGETTEGWWWNKNALQFHTSMDWLRPVMQKICELGYSVQWTITDGATCRIWPYLKNIPSCSIITERPFTAVVKFLQWYNTHKPNTP